MTTGAFSERRLGDHLLVAPLSEDCLGTVFRALHSNDDNRFLRLRILQSPELSPHDVFEAVRKNARWVSSLVHKAVVQRAELGLADGVPFVAWQESTGWTLDLLLARLRATGGQLPVEHALLIAERVAAALEHAWSTPVNGERIPHGLLWPGFVTISNDAEIRTGGFGLAEAVMPSLSRGRLPRDIAPYIASEVREGARGDRNSDVYSIGVILHELLTCRRPTLGQPMADFRSGDAFPPEICPILARCFAPPEERYASPEDLHRALLELLASTSYYSISTISLALFLYKLLNPESHSLPISDAESTNPVEGDLPVVPASEATISATSPKRRISDPTSSSDSTSSLLSETDEGRVEIAEGVLELLKPLEPPAVGAPTTPVSVRRAVAEGNRIRAYSLALAAAAAVGLTIWSVHQTPISAIARPQPAEVSVVDASPRPADARLELTPPPQTGSEFPRLVPASVVQTGRGRPKVPRPRGFSIASSGTAPAPSVTPEQRRSVESLRFEAGIARIEAERLEARELAADQFSEARVRETEGEALFRSASYAQALEAFDRAAGLYRVAENISRERRVERVKIASD